MSFLKCFKWTVLAALYSVEENVEKVDSYKQHQDDLDFTGISIPLSIDES